MITAKELFDDALELVAAALTDGREVRRRLAIDALYYSLYLGIRLRLDIRQGHEPYGEHVAVIDTLKKLGAAQLRVGMQLDRLRNLRNKARYSTRAELTTAELLSARSGASNILKLWPGLLDVVEV